MIPLKQNVSIGHLTGYQTPLVAAYFFEAQNTQDLSMLHDIFLFCQTSQLPYRFLSGGTNTLFAQDRYEGVIIKNALFGYTYDPGSKELIASSGESIWKIAEELETMHEQPLWHRFI